MRRFAYPAALSLILHAALLTQLNLKNAPPLVRDQQRLTVRFGASPSLPQEKINLAHNAHKNDAHDMPQTTGPSSSANTTESSAPFDMSQLRAQAREYADKESGSIATASLLHGDYYGTYSGSDNGTFFFHLDSSGHASGSGQSDLFGIGFIITGSVTSNGMLQMTGDGKAGDARFSGQLNIKTGKVSGTWTVAGFGSGLFAGQHE